MKFRQKQFSKCEITDRYRMKTIEFAMFVLFDDNFVDSLASGIYMSAVAIVF